MKNFFYVISILIPSVASASDYLISPAMEQLCNTLVQETKAAPFAPIHIIRASVREKVQAKDFDDQIFNRLYNEAMTSDEYIPQNCYASYAVLQTAKENAEREYGAPVQNRNEATNQAASYLNGLGGSLSSTYSGSIQTQQQNRLTPTVAVATASNKMSDCDVVLAYESCNKETSSGVFEFAKDWIQKIGGEKTKACNCLSKKLEFKYKGEEESLKKLRRELNKKLTNAVYAQLGKKFQNDYAANIENITFYTSSVPTFFGKTEAEQEEKAVLAQCSNAHSFETAIKRKCGKRIPSGLIEHRVNTLFGVYGKKQGSIAEKLKSLNYTISVLDDNGSTKNSDGQIYTRSDHDTYRASLAKTDPIHQLVDTLILRAMQDPDLSKKVDEEYITPYEILSAEIFAKAKESPQGFLEKYMPELNEDMKQKFLEGMKDSSQTPERNIVSSAIATSMGLHPGFDSMMRDKNILKRAVQLAKQNKISLTNALEMKESGLLDKFQEQCNSIVNNFADAVCIDPEKMSSLLSNEQALKLVPLPYDEQDIVREIMCKNNGEGSSDLMQNLLMENLAEKRSDFHDRMNASIEQQTNPFRKMYTHIKDQDKDVLTTLNNSMRKTRGLISSVKGRDLVSNVFGSDLGSQSIVGESLREFKKSDSLVAATNITPGTFKPEPVTDVNGTINSLSKTESFQKSVAAPHAPMLPQAPYQNSFAAVAQPQHVAPASKSMTDIKKEFREFLSNESNKENVDRLVSGADDSMMKELTKLRDEYTRNQTKLAELSTEHERLKLKMMEDQMRTLEQQKTHIVPETNKKETLENRERTAEGSGLGDMRREIASVTQMDAGSASAGVTSGGSASAGSSSGSKGSLSSASGAQQAIATPTTSGSDSAPAVIVSSQAAKASGLTLETSDYSQEVMSYLEKGAVDINTLIKMKTTGMVYKYKVMEDGKVVEKEMMIDYQSLNDNAKKLLDQKIAAKGIDIRQLERIDGEMKKLKRAYTYNSLKVLLAEQLKQ